MVFPLGCESKPPRRGRQVVADKAMPMAEAVVDASAVGGGIAAQWLAGEDVRVHGAKEELIGEDDCSQRAGPDIQGMGVRAADGYHALALSEQPIPSPEGLAKSAEG